MELSSEKVFEYEWRIHNFTKESLQKHKDQSFDTETFEIYFEAIKTEWKINLKVNESSVGVFLCKLNADSEDFVVKFTAYIITAKNEFVHFKTFDKLVSIFTKEGWGWSSFIKIDDIFTDTITLLKNNALTMGFKINFFNKDNGRTRSDAKSYEPQDFLVQLENLRFSESFTDFTLICSDGKKIPVHRVILAANSPVMKAMLKTPMQEAENHTVNIEDIGEEVMMEIVRYMYTRKVNNIETFASKILYGADKYGMSQLRHVCVDSMIKNLSLQNALEYYILADQYNERDLLKQCVIFIKSNYIGLRHHENWKNLDNKLCSILMDYFVKNAMYDKTFELSL